MTERGRGAIFLAGFMGTGKTEIGRALARRLRRPFFDSDAEVERAAGKTVARLFATAGEKRFRALEKRAVARLSARGRCVVALGGGALLDPGTRALVSARAVALTCTERELWRRLKPELPKRPLLSGGRSALRALLARRRGAYAGTALRCSTTRRPPEAAARLIARRLRERGML